MGLTFSHKLSSRGIPSNFDDYEKGEFVNTPLNIRALRMELPDRGVRLHIRATKSAGFTFARASIELPDSELWTALCGPRAKFATKIAIKWLKKQLPMECVPHAINVGHFPLGQTNCAALMKFGGSKRGLFKSVGRKNILKRLKYLATKDGDPEFHIVFRYGVEPPRRGLRPGQVLAVWRTSASELLEGLLTPEQAAKLTKQAESGRGFEGAADGASDDVLFGLAPPPNAGRRDTSGAGMRQRITMLGNSVATLLKRGRGTTKGTLVDDSAALDATQSAPVVASKDSSGATGNNDKELSKSTSKKKKRKKGKRSLSDVDEVSESGDGSGSGSNSSGSSSSSSSSGMSSGDDEDDRRTFFARRRVTRSRKEEIAKLDSMAAAADPKRTGFFSRNKPAAQPSIADAGGAASSTGTPSVVVEGEESAGAALVRRATGFFGTLVNKVNPPPPKDRKDMTKKERKIFDKMERQARRAEKRKRKLEKKAQKQRRNSAPSLSIFGNSDSKKKKKRKRRNTKARTNKSKSVKKKTKKKKKRSKRNKKK